MAQNAADGTVAEGSEEDAERQTQLEVELRRIMRESDDLVEEDAVAVAVAADDGDDDDYEDDDYGHSAGSGARWVAVPVDEVEGESEEKLDDGGGGGEWSPSAGLRRQASGAQGAIGIVEQPGAETLAAASAQHALNNMPEKSRPLDERKTWFIVYLQDQIQKLKIRTNILRFKYSGYKFWFDGYNIAILLLSALLTFIEAMRVRFDVSTDDMETPEAVVMGVAPIVISSTVTVASALVKFKRYESKMQDLQSAVQQAIYTIYRLKRLQETTKYLTTDEELTALVQMYSEDVYKEYIECLSSMERNLRYEDLVKHMKTYFNLSLEYERSELNYRIDRLLLGATQQLREGDVDAEAQGIRRRYMAHGNGPCPKDHPARCLLFCCCCCWPAAATAEGQQQSKKEGGT